MDNGDTYVHQDEHGVYRVGDTHVMLDSVVAAFREGHSPETIQSQYPALTLEQVYGAIAYYLGNRRQVEEYLRQQDAVWAQEQRRSEQTSGAVVQRLRALRGAGVAKKS